MKEEILRLRSEGKSYNHIVRTLGCAKSTVAYHCNNTTKKKNNEKREEYNKRARAKRRERVELLRRYKSMKGCVDCGNKNPIVLEFDHLEGHDKSFNLSDSSYLNIILIKEEIKKCEVVCANCHRIRTNERKVAKGFKP